MEMQLGIVGMPMVGKTTVFELLTENSAGGASQNRSNIGMARVPDARVDFLSGLFKPRKTTYAQLEVVDIPGLVSGGDRSGAVFLDAVRRADALLMVIRVFDDEVIPAFNDPKNPVKAIEDLAYELLLADLDLVEKRLDRIMESKKKNQSESELALLNRLKASLEEETPVSSLEFTAEEQTLLSSYQFLTLKPILVCINLGEEHLATGAYPGREAALEYAREHNLPVVELCARLEQEIAELEGEEKALFMEEMGIDEAGIVTVARTMYQSLGLISFFTVGEDEVKAWTIEKGTVAREAAGKIHSDIERGFIRAEVVEYNDLEELGNMAAVKEKGLFRLEGKEYIVKDGDIVHFRFNV